LVSLRSLQRCRVPGTYLRLSQVTFLGLQPGPSSLEIATSRRHSGNELAHFGEDLVLVAASSQNVEDVFELAEQLIAALGRD
jgi:hypothetical protein